MECKPPRAPIPGSRWIPHPAPKYVQLAWLQQHRSYQLYPWADWYSSGPDPVATQRPHLSPKWNESSLLLGYRSGKKQSHQHMGRIFNLNTIKHIWQYLGHFLQHSNFSKVSIKHVTWQRASWLVLIKILLLYLLRRSLNVLARQQFLHFYTVRIIWTFIVDINFSLKLMT